MSLNHPTVNSNRCERTLNMWRKWIRLIIVSNAIAFQNKFTIYMYGYWWWSNTLFSLFLSKRKAVCFVCIIKCKIMKLAMVKHAYKQSGKKCVRVVPRLWVNWNVFQVFIKQKSICRLSSSVKNWKCTAEKT